MVIQFVWFLVFIIFCYSSFVSSAKDVKELKLSISVDRRDGGQLKCDVEPLDVEVDGQFRIHVDPGEHNIHCVGRCYKSLYFNDFVDTAFCTDEAPKRKDFTSDPFNVNVTGEFGYKCKFYTNKCTSITFTHLCHYVDKDRYKRIDSGVTCDAVINVHDKGEIVVVNPKGYLTANRASFTRTPDNIHMFFDGEGTNFTCHKTTGSLVKLTYITRAGKEISTGFQKTEAVSLYRKLKKANQEDIVTCNFTDEKYERLHLIQLKLAENKYTQPMITVKVNGQTLYLIRQISTKEYFYEYKFYNRETIILGVDKDDNIYGNLRCSVDGPDIPETNILKNFIKGMSTKFDTVQFILYENSNGTALSCILKKKNLTEIFVKVTFLYRVPDYSPFVSGLPMANLFLQYANATGHNILKYGIAVDEILYLDCITFPMERNCTSYYNHNEVITPSELKVVPRPFHLQPTKSNALIIFNATSPTGARKTYLELVRRREKATPISDPTQPTILNIPKDIIPIDPTTNKNTEQEPEARAFKSKTTKIPILTTKIPILATKRPIVITKKPTRTTKIPILTSKRPQLTTIRPILTTKISTATAIKPAERPTLNKTNSKTSPTVGHGSKSSENDQNTKQSTNAVSEVPTHANREEKSEQDKNTYYEDGSYDHGAAWAIVVAVVLVLLGLAFVLWTALKKNMKMHKGRSSTLDYRSMPGSHEGQLAIRTQRTEAELYATNAQQNSIDNLYPKPTPKNQRNKLEPTYAEPRDSLINHTYLNTQQLKNDPTYASVYNDEPNHGSAHNNEPSNGSVHNNGLSYALVQKSSNASNQPDSTLLYQNIKSLRSLENNELNNGSVYNNDPTYGSVYNNDPTYGSVYNNEPTYGSLDINESTYDPVQNSGNTSKQPGPQCAPLYQNTTRDVYAKIDRETDRLSDKESERYQNQGKVNSMIYADVSVPYNTEYRGKNNYINVNMQKSLEPTYSEIMKKK